MRAKGEEEMRRRPRRKRRPRSAATLREEAVRYVYLCTATFVRILLTI